MVPYNIRYISLKKFREKINAMAGDLYALDFDGVLCDSCGESSISALKAWLSGRLRVSRKSLRLTFFLHFFIISRRRK